jgi:hypothetical protein
MNNVQILFFIVILLIVITVILTLTVIYLLTTKSNNTTKIVDPHQDKPQKNEYAKNQENNIKTQENNKNQELNKKDDNIMMKIITRDDITRTIIRDDISKNIIRHDITKKDKKYQDYYYKLAQDKSERDSIESDIDYSSDSSDDSDDSNSSSDSDSDSSDSDISSDSDSSDSDNSSDSDSSDTDSSDISSDSDSSSDADDMFYNYYTKSCQPPVKKVIRRDNNQSSSPDPFRNANNNFQVSLLGEESKLTLDYKNVLSCNNYSSILTWKYQKSIKHVLSFNINNVQGLWCEVIKGTALIKNNNVEYVYKYNSTYNSTTQKLNLTLVDINNKPLEMSGNIIITIALCPSDKAICTPEKFHMCTGTINNISR